MNIEVEYKCLALPYAILMDGESQKHYLIKEKLDNRCEVSGYEIISKIDMTNCCGDPILPSKLEKWFKKNLEIDIKKELGVLSFEIDIKNPMQKMIINTYFKEVNAFESSVFNTNYTMNYRKFIDQDFE